MLHTVPVSPKPSACLVASVRSNSREPTYGPRSITGTRTVRVPVIDRGPYVGSREFDLTEATKLALGFGDTGIVWSTG